MSELRITCQAGSLWTKPPDDQLGQINVVGLFEEENDHRGHVGRTDHRLAFQAFAEVGAFDEIGINATGAEIVHVDIVRLGLDCQAAREPEQAVFAGAVGGLMQIPLHAGRAGEVDDASLFAGDHVRQDFTAKQERRSEINAHHSLPVGQRNRRNRFFEEDTGIVYENVTSAQVFHRLSNGAGDLLQVGQIAFDELGTDRRSGFGARQQREPHPFPCQRLCDGQPDPPACAGDDGSLAFY